MKFERNFILVALAIAAALPLVMQSEYLLHLGVLVLFSLILATSFNLIVGYVGEFPLGHMAFLGIGAYTAALASWRFGLPIYLTVPIGAAVSAIFGLAIGAITLRLRGPFFVIVTLCFAEVLRLVANNWVGLTNGPMGISGIRKPAWLEAQNALGQKTGFYYIALLLAAVALYVAFRFVYSNLGRAAVAVRENRFVSQSVGISPFRYALMTFVIAAALAGMSGAFYAHYISFVGPEVFGFAFMASTIIIVLLGGKGTLVGPIVGSIVAVLLEEYLRDFKELRLSIFGAIVVAVVIFMPNGIMGFLARRRELRPGASTTESLPAAGITRGEVADARRA
jgi:branched-chain amino acid transport system permease protein